MTLTVYVCVCVCVQMHDAQHDLASVWHTCLPACADEEVVEGAHAMMTSIAFQSGVIQAFREVPQASTGLQEWAGTS